MAAEQLYPGERIVTWDEVHRDTRVLVRNLLELGPWKGIVGISRGGLVPATILARELELRYVDSLCIATYDEQDMGEVNIIKKPEEACADGGAGWLLVDDLVDTGTTMKVAKTMLPASHVATVYAKPDGMEFVDSFVHEVPQKTWVFFPWDMQLQYTMPLSRAGEGEDK